VVVTMFASLELFMVGSDVTRFLHDVFHSTADRPLDVLGARARAFLLYIVPVGALTQLPASFVLGRYTLLEGAVATSWLLGLGLLVFLGFSRSLRRYESAMG